MTTSFGLEAFTGYWPQQWKFFGFDQLNVLEFYAHPWIEPRIHGCHVLTVYALQ
jgi:hypothetical protein